MLSCKHANKILFQKIYPISFFVCMIIQVDFVLLWFQTGMGRKSHDIWTFYKKVEKNGKQRALCNQYMTDIVPLVERMKARHEPFSNELFGESYIGVQTGTWWASGKKLGFNSNLIEVATSITTSSRRQEDWRDNFPLWE